MRYKKKLKKFMIAGILLIAVSGVLAACSPAVATQTEAVQPINTEVPAASTETPESEVAQSDEAAPSGDSESPASPAPTARVGLESTDPATVNLASGQLQLVEAFAFWWGTCQNMAPIVHGLEVEYFDRINFVYLDVDDAANADFLRELGYRYQPHFMLIDGQGNVIQQWLGPVGADDFRAAFDTYLQ